MKEALTGIGIGLLLIAVIYGAVLAATNNFDRVRVCEYEHDAKGQVIREECWKEWRRS